MTVTVVRIAINVTALMTLSLLQLLMSACVVRRTDAEKRAATTRADFVEWSKEMTTA